MLELAARAAHANGTELFIPIKAQVDLAVWFSSFYGAILALICTPIWILPATRGYASGFVAATLGFIARQPFGCAQSKLFGVF
jgi:hypothetical protein